MLFFFPYLNPISYLKFVADLYKEDITTYTLNKTFVSKKTKNFVSVYKALFQVNPVLSVMGSVTKCKIMSEGHSMIQSPTINDYDIV